jgi:ribosomal protein S18 acetylase RimI-like enzyme
MQIRRLAATDAPAFRVLRLRALREHPEAFTSSHDEDEKLPLAMSEQRLQDSETARFWGAFDGPRLCGMVGLEREKRPKNRHKATVVGMYVAPEASSRGVGRALVDAVLREARNAGLELLVLTVTEGNQAATALYERAGFRSFGVEPDAIRVGGVPHAKNHMYLHLGPQA